MRLSEVKARSWLDLFATLMMIAAASIVIKANWPRLFPKAPPSLSIPKSVIPFGASARVGAADAPVVMIAYSDFQCPYCAKFTKDVLPTIRKEYIETGKVMFIFRHFPLQRIHPLAMQSAKLAACSAVRGKFFAVHDMLFEQQAELRELLTLPSRLPITQLDLDQCESSGALRVVEADIASGKEFAIVSTPTFLFGTREAEAGMAATRSIVGHSPEGDFRSILDELVASARRQ